MVADSGKKGDSRISEDDVLRRMLKMPPKPHAPLKERKPTSGGVSGDDSHRASGEKQKPSS
jgi:hypothetical protein